MKLSFIIAHDSFSEEVKNLVDSIYKTIKDSFEVIVVDGSETPIPLDERATVIPCTQTKPFNYNAARNLGSKYASGDFLVFLDATLQPTKSCFSHLQTSIQEAAENKNVLFLGSRIKQTKSGSVLETIIGGDFALCFGASLFEAIGYFDANVAGKQTQEDFERLKSTVKQHNGKIIVVPGFKFISTVIENKETWYRSIVPFGQTDYGVSVDHYRKLYEDVFTKYKKLMQDYELLKQQMEQKSLSESLLVTANQNQILTIEDLKNKLYEEYTRGLLDQQQKSAVDMAIYEEKCRNFEAEIHNLHCKLFDSESKIKELEKRCNDVICENQIENKREKATLHNYIKSFWHKIIRKKKHE